MLSKSGIGIAMKGSSEHVRKHASRTSSYSNNDDGVYYEIKNIERELWFIEDIRTT